MKHGLNVTLVLLLFYISAQIIGLGLINKDIDVNYVDGQPSVQYSDTVIGPRPEIEGLGTFLYILIGVGIGTALILLIIKLKKMNWWKFWFLLAAFLAMSLALGVVMSASIATTLALILALLKVYKPNIVIHNITELLMYAGIAVFLVPLLDLLWASVLLIAFSLYDMYAVWKSKHMVKMAEFQADSNLFAGLTIPYKAKKIKLKGKKLPPLKAKKPKGMRTAILGGGDIAFPLIFSGVVMEWLVQKGISKAGAFSQSLIITMFSAATLLALFIMGENKKFYPAMPFISVGCFLGLLVIFLI